jgi:hypothetical protein
LYTKSMMSLTWRLTAMIWPKADRSTWVAR